MLRIVALLIGAWLLIRPAPLMAADGTELQSLQEQRKALSAMKPTRAEGEEFDQFLKAYCARAGELSDGYKALYHRNPTGKEGSEAFRQWINHLNLAAQGIPERKVELEATEKQLLADRNLSKSFRESIRGNQVDRIHDLGERERFVRSVHQEFTGLYFLSQHLLVIAEFSDAKHARALVAEVLNLPHSKHERPYWESQAKELRARLDRIGKPLPLKFTALDGANIDLKNYTGKVVLIDFWATWCAPCIAGLPKVRSVWEKHKADGFEIICISYDKDRDVLERFIKKNAIPWPQFYSAEGTAAPLVASFDKPGPPAYWLVDRNGMLADVSGWNDLEGKVERLLAKDRTGAPGTK